MTSRVLMLYTIGTVWCAATALRAALALVHRETYVNSWWDAGIAGTGRQLGRNRTIIKLIVMLGIATVCALALADVLEAPVPLYVVLSLAGVEALSELSAPKPKR